MEKYCRVIDVAGRTFHCSQTMGDIFLAHAADLATRGVTELVSLVHEGGVDQLMVGPSTRIKVTDVQSIREATLTVPVQAVTAA